MIKNDNSEPIFFDTNDEPVHILPSNGRYFLVSEVFELLNANSHDDLDRIEVYKGALYCIELRDQLEYNQKATSFWFNNAKYLNRQHGILGKAIFIPNELDLYTGMDTVHVE